MMTGSRHGHNMAQIGVAS